MRLDQFVIHLDNLLRFTTERDLYGVRFRGCCFNRSLDFARDDKVTLRMLEAYQYDSVIPSAGEESVNKSSAKRLNYNHAHRTWFSMLK